MSDWVVQHKVVRLNIEHVFPLVIEAMERAENADTKEVVLCPEDESGLTVNCQPDDSTMCKIH